MAEEETESVQIQDSDKAAVKSSLIKKGRKSIAYLQKKKDDGEKIVQYCPAHLDPYWTMAAEMAGVDIVRYTAPGENIEHRIANLPWWTREPSAGSPRSCISTPISRRRSSRTRTRPSSGRRS